MADDDDDRSTRKELALRRLGLGEQTEADPETILFQHSIMCQTGLPYRNPGDGVRIWKLVNGEVALRVEAGAAFNSDTGDFVPIGLPYGPKPRLLMAHLNAEAMRRQSPVIEVERSLTAFVKALRLDPTGRNLNTIKDQLSRLSASSIRLGFARDGQDVTIKTGIVAGFSVWWPKNDKERVYWPSTVLMSAEYFESLAKHAVPLHPKALMALSGCAMGLDIYAWLAQRLHRIEWGRRVPVPWSALKLQFGWHYKRLSDFKAEFRLNLGFVHWQYRAANVELDRKGMILRHSPPPVKGRTSILVRAPEPPCEWNPVKG